MWRDVPWLSDITVILDQSFKNRVLCFTSLVCMHSSEKRVSGIKLLTAAVVGIFMDFFIHCYPFDEILLRT